MCAFARAVVGRISNVPVSSATAPSVKAAVLAESALAGAGETVEVTQGSRQTGHVPIRMYVPGHYAAGICTERSSRSKYEERPTHAQCRAGWRCATAFQLRVVALSPCDAVKPATDRPHHRLRHRASDVPANDFKM
jgi:hypothetical protein